MESSIQYSLFSIEKSNISISIQKNDVVEELSQIDNKSQVMSQSSIAHYKNTSNLLGCNSEEQAEPDERQNNDGQSLQRFKRTLISENKRISQLQLIRGKNKNGRHNKKMTQNLIPDLESKIEYNNERTKELQEQINKKYAIIGEKAYKMGMKQKIELLAIIQQYKSSSAYFHAEPRKKLLIFIYQNINLIESVKLLSSNQCELQYKSINLQMIIKSQNIKIISQKYELIGNQIYQMLDKHKQECTRLIKRYFNSTGIAQSDRSLMLTHVSQVIKIIVSKQEQPSIQHANQLEKDLLENFFYRQTEKLSKFISKMIRNSLPILLRLFY